MLVKKETKHHLKVVAQLEPDYQQQSINSVRAMTSTPVSLDESLNGSWIDINSASQIHSSMDDDSPEFLRTPYSMAESVQSLGLISFQVERFLQEAQRNQNTNSQQNLQQPLVPDDLSGIYSSDTDVSVDDLDGKAMICSLRRYQKQKQTTSVQESNNNDFHSKNNHQINTCTSQTLSKGGECLGDQLSDSLSLMSRISGNGEAIYDPSTNFQDFDWLWDWTAQPEYFSGQEWKVYAPKHDYLMRQRQLYCANLNKSHGNSVFSGEVISLLFLTNILSIIIGAGLTYSILLRKPTI